LIGGEPPAVIFVSAFDNHAAKAFEVRAIDYILKPVGYERLRSALNRARSEIETRSSEERIAELKEVIRTLREEVRSEPVQRFEAEFWVRRNVTGLLRVPVESIEWISADDDYVCLHTSSGNHLLRDTIRGIPWPAGSGSVHQDSPIVSRPDRRHPGRQTKWRQLA
jgi:DNA-binding LytR/AlgR family response regulator